MALTGREAVELVAAARERHAVAEVARDDPRRGRGHDVDPPQDEPPHRRADADREQERGRDRPGGAGQQRLPEVVDLVHVARDDEQAPVPEPDRAAEEGPGLALVAGQRRGLEAQPARPASAAATSSPARRRCRGSR